MADTYKADLEARLRKERVHTTMLIELLVALVFLAMAFAFVQNEENSFTTLRDRVATLERQLADAQATIAGLLRKNAELNKRNQELQDSLARWMNIPRKSLPANPVIISGDEFRKLQGELANAEDVAAKAQAQVTALKGGHDLPNCAATAGFLLDVHLLASGDFRATPVWPAVSDSTVRPLPGIADLTAGGTQSAAAFSQSAGQLANWGLRQQVACRFRVLATEEHADLQLYKRQMKLLGQFFYPKPR